MANKLLFGSTKSHRPHANARNAAGGAAYVLPAKHALAQLATTGCLSGTFYATGQQQLDEVVKLVEQVDDNQFLAKLAIYARQRGMMKDMPAALLVMLSVRDTELTHQVFDRVVDNGRMLRNVFQMVRSGRFGRKGLSSSLKRAFERWLNNASTLKLLSASIGNDPSLRDVLRMARPKPTNNERRALFGWLTEKPVPQWAPATLHDLPEEVRQLNSFREAKKGSEQARIVRDLSLRWDLLADTAQDAHAWKAIAKQMGPQALRMNLNTLLRQGVLRSESGKPDAEMVALIAKRLSDEREIKRSKQFPYQFLAAYKHASNDVPQAIKSALHRAAEIACGNIPQLSGPVLIGLDVSGSMHSPVTGYRGRGATTTMRCVDVAALFAASILRRNPDSVVVPFDTVAYDAKFDPNDSILSLSDRLARYGGGGTDCSIPLQTANGRYAHRQFAGVILLSDNESWITKNRPYGYGRYGQTGMMSEWQKFVSNQMKLGGHEITSPKLVCIDLQPNTTTQAPERADILNVGGFSDAVFQVVASFLEDDGSRFVAEIDAIKMTE
ncbi:TROVE domain-containing protein [Blastopirellula marina]|uniref:TROVE domain-containing protein n=1 Tax=Blastopirellula marina TaxID=124 RepID=A0A2S8FCZ2_9BACT|nr:MULTISPECIES: TROVE domain-containing protein [Pirellulaceae]PQO30041.1 TROVE domain-containing protein [Blastopirellula marina]RCS50476.1 TROVE domain-containing protein [Bremerella cremea]